MTKKVFVSGCFDMLHSGHVAFFEEASRLGDVYVGVANDRSIYKLKGRKTVNTDEERLYLVKAIKYVKDAWINRGSGLLDFTEEVDRLKPDILFVNADGYSLNKEKFCRSRGIEIIISSRKPVRGFPARSTTALRQDCRMPYRVEICGAWLDQPLVNSLHPGSVVVASVCPDYSFNERSGMATSSRNKAIELWQTELPAGDPEQNAKILFSVENPPGTKNISGSQDQLGILMPGISRLNYDNGYWPKSIETITDPDVLRFVEDHLFLLQLPGRSSDYDVFAGSRVTREAATRLSYASSSAFDAICHRDLKSWGQAMSACFNAQLEMFPAMSTDDVQSAVWNYGDSVYGYKLTGAGGGGYLLLISETPVTGAVKIRIRT